MYSKKKFQKKNIETKSTFVLSPTKNYSSTYLGKKGYTILKSEISPEVENDLKTKLTVIPATGAAAAFGGPVVSYPVYRESINKYYIPRYFGIEYFGVPKEYNLSEGQDINIPFHGSMREAQIPVIDAFMQKMNESGNSFGGGLLELPCAAGKTVLSLKIISILKKKTLVIVNKEFLLNQWIERIREFLPTAKVGTIQGPTIDVEGKDIVIGMLQSISKKDYSPEVFNKFGLTIIDEVHHISSQVFSCALFKIISKYMIGLSATMERKDGTTYVFKMFLGDIIYSGKRDEGYDVVVRAILFNSNDTYYSSEKLEDDGGGECEGECDDGDEASIFSKTDYDFRGNPQYSKMIVKVCSYGPRSDFIIRILQDLINEDSTNQIMILSQNRSLLTYLYKSLQHKQFASFGFYVGGMKQKDLDESEKKQIILATYSMAAEALDIKTLSVLVMATSKVDIEQSVGRILRTKNKKKIIVDILDTHRLFQNQWNKRKNYYKKCKYLIKTTDSFKYLGMNDDGDEWKTIFNPVIVAPTKSETTSMGCLIKLPDL
jgi:superfamily II DNA or RNA helicase